MDMSAGILDKKKSVNSKGHAYQDFKWCEGQEKDL